MKKLLTIALSLVMVFSMTAVSFADTGTIEIGKVVSITNGGTTCPNETFYFTVDKYNVSDSAITNPQDIPTISGFSVDYRGVTSKATISIPDTSAFTTVGIYTYKVKETPGTTAGIDYSNEEMYLQVTVSNGEAGLTRDVVLYKLNADGTKTTLVKTDNFTNVYSAGSLAVSKEVTGNMGDKTKDFKVTVTFTAPAGKTVNSTISYTDGTTDNNIVPNNWTNGTATAEITLKHDETVTFTNIPYGVTYTVVEDDYTGEGYDAAGYTFVDSNKIIDTASETVTITNNKGIHIDTGIFFDNGIYIAILAIVLIAAAAFIIRRRQHRYDA